MFVYGFLKVFMLRNKVTVSVLKRLFRFIKITTAYSKEKLIENLCSLKESKDMSRVIYGEKRTVI